MTLILTLTLTKATLVLAVVNGLMRMTPRLVVPWKHCHGEGAEICG